MNQNSPRRWVGLLVGGIGVYVIDWGLRGTLHDDNADFIGGIVMGISIGLLFLSVLSAKRMKLDAK